MTQETGTGAEVKYFPKGVLPDVKLKMLGINIYCGEYPCGCHVSEELLSVLTQGIMTVTCFATVFIL